MKRWKIIISYKHEYLVDDEHEIEELAELHDIVELGTDWRLIDAVTITLNRQ